MTDYADVYRTTRAALVQQLTGAGTDVAGRTVPGCPDWTVKDTVAHLSGLVTDLLAGVKPPLGTPEMTSRQVGERADMSLAEVCGEWEANSDGIAGLMGQTEMIGLGLTADLAVHVHDIAEVIEAVECPAKATSVACERYVPLLQERVAERLDAALSVEVDGRTWEASAGATPLRLTASGEDLLLALTGRRTRAQVEDSLTWDGDGSGVLDTALLQYGPYRGSS